MKQLGVLEQSVVRRDAAVQSVRPTDFEAFFRANHDPIYRAICTTLGGETELASDAVDEAMARAFQRWVQVQNYMNPPGWVYRVALNFARTRLRRRERRPRFLAAAAVMAAPDFEPEIYESLLRLPLEQRSVIVLKYYLDWTLPQIAGALELPEGTVKSRLGRGLQRLREEASLEL